MRNVDGPNRGLDYVGLSRALSHALRHEPWLYELELDAEGWVDVDDIVAALRGERTEWAALSIDDLAAMIAAADKQRHELQNGRIRALYGHSTPDKLVKNPATPPDVLFHGTSPSFLLAIQSAGLLPMRRQYVHLSAEEETALQVGKRKSRLPVILHVQAKQAHDKGVPFYRGNEKVWLADQIPSEFIVVPEN